MCVVLFVRWKSIFKFKLKYLLFLPVASNELLALRRDSVLGEVFVKMDAAAAPSHEWAGWSPGWLAAAQRTVSNHNLVYFHHSSLWSLSPSRIYIEKIHRDSYRHHKWVTWHLWHYSKTQTKTPLCLADLTDTEDCGQLYLAAISRSTRADVIFQTGGGIVLAATNMKNVEKRFDANQRNKTSKNANRSRMGRPNETFPVFFSNK